MLSLLKWAIATGQRPSSCNSIRPIGNHAPVYTRWMSLPNCREEDFHSKPVGSVIGLVAGETSD